MSIYMHHRPSRWMYSQVHCAFAMGVGARIISFGSCILDDVSSTEK